MTSEIKKMSRTDDPIWRVGSKLGRTIYRDDVCVGMVDTPEIAKMIVFALNMLSSAGNEPPAARIEPAQSHGPKPDCDNCHGSGKWHDIVLVKAKRDARRLAEGIARAAELEVDGIFSSDRSQLFASARQELYLALWKKGYAIADIGRIMRRHHTTVIHGLKALLGREKYERMQEARDESR